jgi:hypothetical protein
VGEFTAIAPIPAKSIRELTIGAPVGTQQRDEKRK